MAPSWASRIILRALRISPAFVLASLVACGSGSSTPSSQTLVQNLQKLSQTTETAHFTFHYSPGDSVDATHEEAYYTWAAATLAVQPTRKIDYYKYLDRSQMQSITGRITNGWADPPTFAIHSIWQWDNHEVIHVYTALIGRPSDYFNEGIAVAMQTDPSTSDLVPRWSGTPLHTIARTLLQNGQLPHAQDICDTDTFRTMDDSVSYPMAGSFVEFLVERYGMAKVLEFFRLGTREDSRSKSAANFQQTFGSTLADADLAWRTFLSTP